MCLCGSRVDVVVVGGRMVLPISNTGPSGPTKKGTRQMDFSSKVKRMVKRAALVGAGVCVAAMGACAPAYATESTPTELIQGWVTVDTGAPVDVSGTPACEDEGQEYGPCLWDATVSGNGSGDSFIVEEDGSVTYIRKQDGTATGVDVKKKKKSKKKQEETEAPAPEPTEPAEARRFPGWEWTGKTDPISAAGLPHCVDVRGQETCMRDGYVIVVDQDACTQTLVTDAGDQYVPGPAVAEALSDACKARKDGEEKDHEDNAGFSGSRSRGDVHSASPSAAVDGRVEKSASPSATATVGSVGSHREVVAAPAPVKDNYDHEILGVLVALGVLGLSGVGLVAVVDRVRGWMRRR